MNPKSIQRADTAEAAIPTDDFLASIRIDQSFSLDTTNVIKHLVTVPVRKPQRGEFIRVHPALHQDCLVIERKEERETYVVYREFQGLVAEFAESVRLRLCVNRQGTVFLWPVKQPRDDQRGDSWRRSAAEAAAMAEAKWLRVSADMNLGAYQPYVATGDLGEPQWPKQSLADILRIAFKGQVIDSHDHAVIRQLQGHV